LSQLVKSERVSFYVIAVMKARVYDHVDDGESEGGVGPWPDLKMLMAVIECAIAIRIDAHEPGSGSHSALDLWPQVNVRSQRVRAPEANQRRAIELLHAGAVFGPARFFPRLPASSRADSAGGALSPKPGKNPPVHASAVYDPHRAAVAVRQDGFGPG